MVDKRNMNYPITLTARMLSLAGCSAVLIGLIFTPARLGLSPIVTRHNLIILCTILIAAFTLSRIVRWTLANGLLLIGALLLARFVGVGPLLAAALLVAAAVVIGTKVCRSCCWDSPAIIVLVGLAVLAGISGWLLPFPIHYFMVYLGVLGGLVVWGHRDLRRTMNLICNRWRNAIAQAPIQASIAMLAVVMGGIALCAPTIQYDDMASHILMPEQLIALGYYKMDVASQIWAAAPWASDIVQSYIAVLSGHEARGAANLIWFSLTIAMIWGLGEELDLPHGLRWLAVALYASLPIVVALNGSMQADAAITTVTVALTAIVVRITRIRTKELLLPFFIISGLAIALKVTQGLLVLPLSFVVIAYLGWRPFLAQTIRAFIPAVLIAGSSYAYAFYVTGNPIFPVFNGVFKSPYAPSHNFDDPRWHQGLAWNSLWRITFETNRYLEALPGAVGFSILALSGAVIWTLTMPRVRWVTLALAVAASGIFLGIQYARYVAPIIPALVTLGLVAWDRAKMKWRGEVLLAAVVFANIVFMPTSLYIFGDDLYWRLLTHIDQRPSALREDIQRSYSVERLFANYLRTTRPDGYSLFLSDSQRPFIAPFGGHAFDASWYDPTFNAEALSANDDKSGSAWTSLFERTGMSDVLTNSSTSVAIRASLKQIGALPELSIGDFTLWRLCGEGCASQIHGLANERDISRHVIRSRRYLLSRLGSVGILGK